MNAVHKPAMSIVVQRHPNPQFSSFHVDRVLSNAPDGVEFKYDRGEVRPDESSLEASDLPIEPSVQAIAERIYAIPGISDNGPMGSNLWIGKCEIFVGKGVAFPDREIEEGVIAAIAKSFGLNVEDVTVTINDQRGKHSRAPSRLL
ncbi:MAG: hypothetical protein ABI397_01705, partial [Candidatus Saccharimonas sp.]